MYFAFPPAAEQKYTFFLPISLTFHRPIDLNRFRFPFSRDVTSTRLTAMELAQELLVTAVVAVLFSFVIAKLISFAMSADSDGTSKVAGVAGDAVGGGRVAAAAAAFVEEKLPGPPNAGGDRRVVEAVEEVVRKVDRLDAEPVVVKKIFGTLICGEEAGLEHAEEVDDPLEVGSGEGEELAEEAVKCEVEDNVSSREARESCDVEDQFPAVDAAGATDVDVEEEEIIDEDDWEGIEKTELEEDFIAAVRYVDDMNEGLEAAAVGDDVKMKLYGLHKVATEGPCHVLPPMAVKVAARAKWYH